MAKLMPDLPAGHHEHGFHDAEQNGETERERHEDEVIERGNRELQASQLDNIHDRFSIPAAIQNVGGHCTAIRFRPRA